MVKVDLILIGNELLNGKISDKNAQQLSRALNGLNACLNKVQIVRDDKEQLQKALKLALDNSEIIVTSGGLGPTKDDQTKEIIADYFQKEIKLSDEALKFAKKIYEKKDRIYDQKVMDYHLLPDGFSLLDNETGFAPGLHYHKGDKDIFLTPGVPHEFKSMIENSVLPIVKSKAKNESTFYQFTARTWKIPESKIFNEIDNTLWEKLEKFGDVSSLPHIFGVDIGVAISGNKSEIEEQKREIENILCNSPVKDYIWSYGQKSICECIVEEASEKNLTIGFSESCTGGLCASMITDVSGSSKIFFGSVVSYANEVKMKSLSVSEKTLQNHGAVSEQTALEMAKGARSHLEVDIAVSTTGIAGPLGGSPEKPVGTVGIGFATKSESSSRIFNFKGDREMLKQRFAHRAMITMLEQIRKA